jgi:hypothetical protein
VGKLKGDLGHIGKIAGVFWMQGESDTNDSAMASNYQSNLIQLIERFRRDFAAPELPFVLGQINNAGPFQSVVRAAQAAIPSVVANTAFEPTDDLQRSSYPGDSNHFTTRGTIDLGIRFAGAYNSLDHILIPSTPGDYDGNSQVNAGDYNLWRSKFGTFGNLLGTDADGNDDGMVDAADYVIWRQKSGGPPSNQAAVPEPNLTIFVLFFPLIVLRQSAIRSPRDI